MKLVFTLFFLSLVLNLAAAHAENRESFNYECVDAAGETYDLTDSSGLKYIRVEADQNHSLLCQRTNDDSQAQLEYISTRKPVRGPHHKHVKSHCLSAGQACYGLYCQEQCCHSPAGTYFLYWYDCE